MFQPSGSAAGKSKAKSFHWESSKTWFGAIQNLVSYTNHHIMAMNNSKIFAGIIIIVLNISSKFVTIKLSKTMESYLKHTFSRDALIFAMAWMGTRDIYVALMITVLFVLCMNYFFNENSALCCLPESFTSYHLALPDDPPEHITLDDVEKSKRTLRLAKERGIIPDTTVEDETESTEEQ